MRSLLRWIDHQFIRYVGPFARTALAAAIVTALGLIAGLFGSVYTDDIRSAFPFVLDSGPISGRALLFWSCALSATVLFFVGQRTAEIDRIESEVRLDRRSDELGRLIRSVPPSDFLFTFREIFWDCGEAWAEIVNSHNDLTPAAVGGAIRIVLAGAAKLAQKFDAAPAEVVYAANIMRSVPSEKLNDEMIASLKKSLKFAAPETDLRALKGLLVIDTELSTTTRKDVLGKPDDSLVPLTLAIPREARDAITRRWRVLPGAPMAFCCGGLQAYVDSRTLGQWCRKEGDFPESSAVALEEYFNGAQGESMRGFVSIPIKRLEDEPIGVLNIHRNRPGLLEEKLPAEQFAPLVTPLVFLLIGLLEISARIGDGT